MFKNKGLKYIERIERVFQIERENYNETIEYLRDRVCELEEELKELKTAGNPTIKDLTSETIKQLEIKNRDLAAEVARLEKELSECGKKLNATQYKEYKRLKQNEYQRRWYKKSKQSK